MTGPDRAEIERVALQLWQRRELRFPEKTRRMVPDDLDRANGSWQRCRAAAVRLIRRRRP